MGSATNSKMVHMTCAAKNPSIAATVVSVGGAATEPTYTPDQMRSFGAMASPPPVMRSYVPSATSYSVAGSGISLYDRYASLGAATPSFATPMPAPSPIRSNARFVSFTACREQGMAMDRILSTYPDVHVDAMFQTGLAVNDLVAIYQNPHVSSTIVTMMVERGLNYSHIMRYGAAEQIAQGKSFVATNLPFRQHDWIKMGIRSHADLGIDLGQWMKLR